jgi:glycosyltransferase involved in cell wall biosynthesis
LLNYSGKSWFSRFDRQRILENFITSRRAFVSKSRQFERRIRQLNPSPDWIIHVFGLSCPQWERVDIPYVYYLDHTMALAKKVWPLWLPYNAREYNAFLEYEKLAYQRATHLFSMSDFVRRSLIEDYGIPPEKITVVGSAGNFKVPYQGIKAFGSKRILFNGSDFYRKGGDIVLEAFKLVKQKIPQATLIIIGTNLNYSEPSIENPGHLDSPDALTQLFLNSDLVVAPARCDPFPGFVIEAMNYGVPCIVSANGGISEVIEDRINGVVLSKLQSEALAEEIVKLLNNTQDLQNLSENARLKVAERLNWELIADTMVKTLTSLNIERALKEEKSAIAKK